MNNYNTPRPDLNKLSKEVYEANKAKGFHDKEHNNEHLLFLVICELSEAVEADRIGKRANTVRFLKRIETSRSYKGLIPDISRERAYEVIYNETIKGSIEEELADAVIRLLDLAGLRGYDEPLVYSKKDQAKCFAFATKKHSNKTFSELIYATTATLFGDKPEFIKIKQCLLSIEWLCNHLSIDLWLHVDLKLKYNKTRPQKHGKLY